MEEFPDWPNESTQPLLGYGFLWWGPIDNPESSPITASIIGRDGGLVPRRDGDDDDGMQIVGDRYISVTLGMRNKSTTR